MEKFKLRLWPALYFSWSALMEIIFTSPDIIYPYRFFSAYSRVSCTLNHAVCTFLCPDHFAPFTFGFYPCCCLYPFIHILAFMSPFVDKLLGQFRSWAHINKNCYSQGHLGGSVRRLPSAHFLISVLGSSPR